MIVDSLHGFMKKTVFAFLIYFMFVTPVLLTSKNSKDLMSISKLTGNIHIIDQNPVNNFVHLASIGKDGILLVDTAFRETGEELLQKLKEWGNGTIKYVVNTHIHSDHIGSNCLFSKEAMIISHQKTRERYLKSCGRAGIPVMTFTDTLKIFFNGESIIIKHMKCGHTDCDVTVYFPLSKVLYIGDLVIHNRFSTVDLSKGGNAAGFIENLKLLINDYPDDTRYFPSHGPEYNKEKLKAYLDAFVSTAPQIKNQLNAEISVDEIVKSDVFKKFKKWKRMKDWVEVLKNRDKNR